MDFAVPKIMGVLNVTPDSFSDGGKYLAKDLAIQHALHMISDGAQIIDIGGESTRPYAQPVSVDEECQRVVPVVEALRQHSDITISVDTRHTAVMKAALDAGADLINDIYALQDSGALELVAEKQVPVCIMHMQNQPQTMQQAPRYENVVKEVFDFLQERIKACRDAGVQQKNIWIDLGFGFGKTLAHNLELLANLRKFKSLGSPILVGVSKKAMFGALLNASEPNQRLFATLGAEMIALMQGANIIRTHEVKATSDILKVLLAVQPYWHRSETVHDCHA